MCAASFAGINRYLRDALASAQEAEDATQQVLAQALSALPRYRAEGTPFRGWLFTIAHNHAVNLNLRRQRSHTLAPFELDQIKERNDSRAPVAAPGERDSFRTLIATLPRAQQQVLVLLYQHDMSAEQAARALHRTPESVRRLHKRARDALRAIVLAQSKL
jgi:RNA polymerase sigma-70 factor (ECF subfamily)